MTSEPFPFTGFDTLSLHAGQLSPEQQRAAGVTDEYVRLSVGIDSIDDSLADLASA